MTVDWYVIRKRRKGLSLLTSLAQVAVHSYLLLSHRAQEAGGSNKSSVASSVMGANTILWTSAYVPLIGTQSILIFIP